MPFTTEHMLLQWSGIVHGTSANNQLEIFSGSMRFANFQGGGAGGSIAGVDNDDALTNLIADLTTFWQNTDSNIPGNYRITSVKWNRIGTNGRYATDTTRERAGLNIEGGAGGAQYPLQIAWATTWSTAVARGLAKKGRTYWPTRVLIDSDSLVVSEARSKTMANQCAELIRDFADWEGLDTTGVAPAVMSGVREGATRAITAVQVGRRLDVLRSRAGEFMEGNVQRTAV